MRLDFSASRANEAARHTNASPGVKATMTPLHRIMQLQRLVGNQAVMRVMRPRLQAQLRVGPADDVYEREADRIADQVMRMPQPSAQRKCTQCEEDERDGMIRPERVVTRSASSVRRDETNVVAPAVVPPIVGEVVSESGRPLDPVVRSFMEPRFGHDFSHVQIHTGSRAAESARAVNAVAYTVGRDVVFDEGAYRPETDAGRRLLAHELTHVIQQGSTDASVEPDTENEPGDSTTVHANLKLQPDAGSERRARRHTAGRNVVFDTWRYEPGTSVGRRLLAHELTHVVRQGVGTTASPDGVLQRYSHEDCTEADLRAHIWPADGIASAKVNAAIAAVTASPVAPSVEALFTKYFMTRTPAVATIARVFREVKAAFDGNAYTYECEDDCDPGKNAYSGSAWDIHLCMNNIRGRANDCIARTIIHEFTHKYAGTGHGWWFSTAHCYSGCDTAGCPAALSASEALDNAYSYAGFAHEV